MQGAARGGGGREEIETKRDRHSVVDLYIGTGRHRETTTTTKKTQRFYVEIIVVNMHANARYLVISV